MVIKKVYGRRALRSAVGITMLVMLLSGIGAAVTAPNETWNKTYGGFSNELVYSVQQTSDGGYILVGYTESFSVKSGVPDGWLIKTDSSGNEQWNKTYGVAGTERTYSVQQTSDGGYILAGSTDSFGAGGGDAWLVKTDSSGNEQWNKTYGGTTYNLAYSIQQTSDGGYIFAGFTYGTSYTDAWLVKTDSSGNEQWNKTFGGTWSTDYAQFVQQTSDRGYILAGATTSSGDYDAWLIKTNSSGTEQWNKKFVVSNMYDQAYSVQQTSDGGYVLAGNTFSWRAYDSDAWLIKTNSSGDQQWSKIFGGTLFDIAYSVQQTSDGGYVLVGRTDSFGAGSGDAWLVKTDSSGNEQWNKTFGGSSADYAKSVQQTPDGGYILAGYTNSFGDYGSQGWLIKLSSDATDEIAPNTTIILAGTIGNNNWYVSNVEVNLTAEDNEDGSGLNKTEYSLDNATWTTYNGNFTISTEDTTIVYYRSRDIAGNTEETKNISINIDKSKPSITINIPFGEYFAGQQVFANWQAIDLRSGIATIIATNPNGTVIDTSTVGLNTFYVNATDNAGNEENRTAEYNVIEYYNGLVHVISGTVIDSESKIGIAGVKVSANATLSTVTNSTGFYSFSVTEGTYNLTATFDITYYTNSTMVSTIGKATAWQDIELVKKPTGNITGNVTKCCT